MILLIDNYDSFSYNLYQLIGSFTPDITVIRNDERTVDEIAALSPSHIILSPGPGKPKDAGVCIEIVQRLGARIPILGVCLGHQAIFEAYGGTVSYASQLMHGKQSQALLSTNCPLFQNVPGIIHVARYHSLSGVRETLPSELEIVATTTSGDIMAVAHREYPVYGLQFHPESILTSHGDAMIQNFLEARHD